VNVIEMQPDPLGDYAISPGWVVGDLLFLSGQAAIDAAGAIVGVGDFDAQLEATFANIDRVLAAGGSDRSRIVKVTIYLTDMANFPKIVEARQRYFTKPWPADTTLEVKALALPELMVEIDVIAVRG
jgi:reactive intermediate/imine deaminase